MGETYDDTSQTPTTWRFVRASRAHVVIDACAYFDLMYQAMYDAKQRIMLIGWDFDTRIHMGRGRRWWNLPRKARPPARLGGYILWLTERTKGLQVRVLKWNFGALKFVLRGSMVIDLARWLASKAVDFKFDSAHPFGCSPHQKIVVIDDNFAVCGGIDMTSDRWDTPAHIDEDARRRMPFARKLYGPWHDLTMMVEGEAAAALGALGRMRWEQAGGDPMEPCRPQEGSAWPANLAAEFRDVEIGISRTRAKYKELGEIDEIEQLYLEHIRRAKRFIYAESQYFASRTVAEAIAARMAEPDPIEFVLINPESAEGWLEQAAMDGARIQLASAIRDVDPQRRFRIFLPMTACGTPIYVHAKMMIVDDEVVRVGSSNLNNRSMGLDTEADVFIDAARPGNEHTREPIKALRCRLLAEHLGIEPEAVAAALDGGASMIELIEATPRHGKYLAHFELRDLTDAERTVADNALLDPEKPEELFEPITERRGLFGGSLRRPRKRRWQR
jgi:phosphatidylserine/phosphatidylglycerophosphate/cardiolipin synthase-like enzyme